MNGAKARRRGCPDVFEAIVEQGRLAGVCPGLADRMPEDRRIGLEQPAADPERFEGGEQDGVELAGRRG